MHERFSAWLGKGFAATQRRGPQGVERLGFKSMDVKDPKFTVSLELEESGQVKISAVNKSSVAALMFAKSEIEIDDAGDEDITVTAKINTRVVEKDTFLAEKVNAVLAGDLTPIYCCGEALEIREAGTHVDFVGNQLKAELFHLSAEEFSKVVVAYEPIWAIGTGVTASPAQAQEMHKELRQLIANQYGEEVAQGTSILYGGSVKPANAKEIFSCPDVDGGLVGGASLKADMFLQIIAAMEEIT